MAWNSASPRPEFGVTPSPLSDLEEQPYSLHSLFQLQEYGEIRSHEEAPDCMVDGGRIGDVPAKYVIKGLREHELPVVGTYVDPNIVPGFCYQVRPADSKKMLFQVSGFMTSLNAVWYL